MKIVLIYAASWMGMMILAILNGIIRENIYGQFMHELSAHQLSTFILIILFGVYSWIITSVFLIESTRQAFIIGGMWFVMTVVFEFGFGHYLMGYPWNKLFHDYNLLKGRIWLLVLLWMAIAPYVFYRIRS